MKAGLTISINPVRDRDILEWYANQSNRSAAVRAAIRNSMASTSQITMLDLQAALERIQQEVILLSRSLGRLHQTPILNHEAKTSPGQIPGFILESLDRLGE